MKYNIAFTKNTHDEARREWLRQFHKHKEEARVSEQEPSIDDEISDAVLAAIDEMPETANTINVEVSGPKPLLITVEKGPR